MSVINRVLQNLESRKALPGTSSPAGLRPAGRASTDKRRLAGILGLGAVVIGVAGWGELPEILTGPKPRMPSPVGPSAPPSMTATAAAVEPAASVPVQLALAAEKPAAKPPVAPAAAPSLPASAAMVVATATAPVPALPIAQAEPASAPSIEKQMRAATPAQRAQLAYRAALELAASGHNSQAVERALEAVKADASLNDARQLAATLLAESGRYEEAAALAREGLARLPNQPPLVYLLARLAAERGDSGEALGTLNKAPALNADGHGLRAGLLSQRGEFKQAAADYQAALRAQPGNSLWWLGLGVALEADGQREQARQVYARAHALGLDHGELGSYLEQKLRSME